MSKPVNPPVYFLVALLMMLALHMFLPVYRWVDWPWRLGGAAGIAAGAAIMLRAAGLFDKRGTTIKPFEEPSALVADGPFRFSRNPMYLSMILILAGIATLLGTATTVLVLPLFYWVISVKFIAKEEAALEARFGQRYLEYKRTVRRWL